MHQYDLIIAPLISLLSIAIGFIVYLNDRKNVAGKVMAVMSSSIGIWVLSAFLSDIVKDQSLSLILNRIIFVAIIIFMGSMLYLPFVFPYKSRFADSIKWPLLVFLFIFALITLMTTYIISDIKFESWGSNIIYGNFFTVFIIFTVLAILISIIKFIISYIKVDKEEKSKIRLFFTGLILVSLINIFIQVVVRNIVGSDEYYRFGNYSVIIFVAYTAYAIVKHQLFNVKVILTETAVVLLSTILFIQIFLSNSSFELTTSIIIFIISIYGGYILIKSVLREIEFRKELQILTDQLAKANAHLKDLDKMKTEFVSLASHELLTPVSAIEGYLSMILDEHLAKVDDPKAAQYLDRIYRSSRRLARLIADMLNISRIEEGRLLVEKKDVNLNELVTQTIDELKFKAEERKQTIVFDKSEIRSTKSETNSNIQNKENDGKDIANELRDASLNAQHDEKIAQNDKEKARDDEYFTYADPDKIKEVIVNIIGNSIKYSKDPGTISIHIEKAPTEKVKEIWAKIEDQVKDQPLDDQEAIKASVNEYYRQFVGKEQLLIIVKDQGIGIPKEELTKLFKKFHRVGDYSTEESQGTGLGLYISRSLVELHHGRIWADSEGRGKGSTFTFSLPDISDKEALLEMEKQVPNQKEQLKPLAKPMNEKIGEDI